MDQFEKIVFRDRIVVQLINQSNAVDDIVRIGTPLASGPFDLLGEVLVQDRIVKDQRPAPASLQWEMAFHPISETVEFGRVAMQKVTDEIVAAFNDHDEMTTGVVVER